MKILSAEARLGFVKEKYYYRFPANIKCIIDYDKKKNNYLRIIAKVNYTLCDSYHEIDYIYSYLCLNENTNSEITILSGNSKCTFANLPDSNVTANFTNVTVYIESLSEDYYHLREALNAQHEDDDSPFGSEVIEIPSNINNGYGIFTCISRDSICAKIIK